MSSTYSTGLQVEMPATNEQSGSWGNTVNTNLGTVIEESIRGVTTVSVTTANVDLTYASPPLQTRPGRHAVLRLTGTSTAARTIFVNATSKVYIVDNATSGGFDHVIRVTGSGGTAVTIPNGRAMLVYTDGADFYTGQTYMSGFVLSSGATMTGALNLPSNGLNVGSGQLQVTGGNVSASGAISAASMTPTALTVSGAAALNGNTTLGDNSSDTLTVNATATHAAATTFSAAATFNGAVTANGAVTLGDTSGDAIAVVGTATFTPFATFSSGLQVVASIAASPAIRCQTDTNTGVYFSGSDAMGLSTSGAARLHVDSSGNVGVGTQSPGYVFQVIGAAAQRPGASVTPLSNGDLVFEATSNSSVTIKLKGSDGTVRSAVINLT